MGDLSKDMYRHFGNHARNFGGNGQKMLICFTTKFVKLEALKAKIGLIWFKRWFVPSVCKD